MIPSEVGTPAESSGALQPGTARFEGRTALVTGAGAGFGRATAVGLAREGAAHVGLVERYPDRLDAVCAEIEAHGAKPHPIAADLQNAETAAAVVEQLLGAAGGLEILISNHVAMGKEGQRSSTGPTPTGTASSRST